MKDLRRIGFTNREIMVMTGMRWKESSIKKYTRGVKVVSRKEKDRVLSAVRELVASDKTVEEVEDFLVFKKKIATHVSMDTFVTMGLDFIGSGIPLNDFVDLYIALKDSNRSLDDLQVGLERLGILKGHDIGLKELQILVRLTSKFGGLESIHEAFKDYESLEDMQKIIEHAEKYLETLAISAKEKELNIKELEQKGQVLKLHLETVKYLYDNNFDLVALENLMELAKKIGEPFKVFKMLLKYGKKEEIEKEISELVEKKSILNEEIEKINMKLKILEEFIENANQKLGEIEANQKNSITAQNIFDLLNEGGDIEIDPHRFKNILLGFLLSIKNHFEKYSDSYPKWQSGHSSTLKFLINAVTDIM
jgi:hypothetical protein